MTTYTLKYNGYELINEYNVSTRYNNIPNIPEDATEFYCENNALTVLPDLPLELNVLHCENNLLVTLPDLPDNLNVLHCNHNRLTILPDLPNTIMRDSFLFCNNNLLVNLPNLPNNLLELNCEHNHLNILPNLPDNLTTLYCGNNRLIHFPVINKKLSILCCENNRLKHFPVLPEFMIELRFAGNPFTEDAIKEYGKYIQNNQVTIHDLDKFVTPEYGRLQSLYTRGQGITTGNMSVLPLNLLDTISRRFHIAGKTEHKKTKRKRKKN